MGNDTPGCFICAYVCTTAADTATHLPRPFGMK